MKVKQLIEILSEHDPEAEVVLETDYWDLVITEDRVIQGYVDEDMVPLRPGNPRVSEKHTRNAVIIDSTDI